MKRRLFIVLNSPTEQNRAIVSYWWDWERRSRFMWNGSFNVDKWESAQTHLCIAPGADARGAWKEAWRMVRVQSRDKKLGLRGYTLLDPAAHIDGEALPLP
mgnify:CR=1 FL=1